MHIEMIAAAANFGGRSGTVRRSRSRPSRRRWRSRPGPSGAQHRQLRDEVAGLVARDQADIRADQRQPDHQDDHPGDQRREEAQHHRERLGHEQAEDAGDDERAVDVGQPGPAAVLVGDDDHRVEHRERRPGHHGQPHAHDLADADRLDDRRDAGDEQVRADQDRDVGRVETHRGPDDQRDGDGARVHDEQVLQPQQRQPGSGQDLVDGVHASVSSQRARSRTLPVLDVRNGAALLQTHSGTEV
jgi:hypothetical protein